MVKVVRKRNKVKCWHCHSILKFEVDDIIEKKFNDGSFRGNYIKCPVCHYEIEIDARR